MCITFAEQNRWSTEHSCSRWLTLAAKLTFTTCQSFSSVDSLGLGQADGLQVDVVMSVTNMCWSLPDHTDVQRSVCLKSEDGCCLGSNVDSGDELVYTAYGVSVLYSGGENPLVQVGEDNCLSRWLTI